MKKDIIFKIVVAILCFTIIYIIINNIYLDIQIKKTVSSSKSTIKDPIQRILNDNKQEVIDFKGVKITKLATYEITGRVMGMEYYYFGSGANKISPEDLVLAWGPAATDKYAKDISVKIGSNDRFANFSITGDYANDYKDKAGDYISNNHIIPMNNRLKSILKKIRKDDVVQIIGYLVKCEGDNWYWGPSSMSRTDDGAHACEIILAESIAIID